MPGCSDWAVVGGFPRVKPEARRGLSTDEVRDVRSRLAINGRWAIHCRRGRRPLRTAFRMIGAISAAVVAMSAGYAQSPGGSPTTQADPARTHKPLSAFVGVPVSAGVPRTDINAATGVREKYEKALKAIDERRPDLAATALDEAIDAAGEEYFELYHQLARCKFQMGKFGESRTAAEKAASLRPESVDAQFLLGKLYRRGGQNERAIERFRTATLGAERDVTNVRVTLAWHELGECLEESGYLAAAAEAFGEFDRAIWETNAEHRTDDAVQQILTRSPYGHVERRAGLWRRLGKADEALRVVEWASKTRPQNAYLARLHVAALLESGKSDDALRKCRERLSAGDAGEDLARLAVQAAEKAGALDSWLASLKADAGGDETDRILTAIAGALDALGRRDKAVEWWRVAVAAKANDIGRAWSLAAALREAGSLREAIETLAESVRRNPDSAHLPAARLANWMKRFSALDEFLALAPQLDRGANSDFALQFVLGATAAAGGQDELAERWLGASLEKKPEFALAHLAWAELLLRRFRWEPAREHAKSAVKIAPSLAAAHFALAQAHDGLDENDEAETEFKTAARHDPDEAAYPIALARHCQRLGNLLGAQRYFQQAFAIDRTRGDALEGLIDSYLAAGKTDVAESQGKAAEDAGVSDDSLRRIRTTLRFDQEPLADAHMAELKAQFAAHPDDLASGVKLGASLYVRREHAETEAVAGRLRNLAPDDERVRTLSAKVAMRRLAYGEAASHLELLAERYPNRATVLTALAELYTYDFRVADAIAIYERLAARTDNDDEKRGYREQIYLLHAGFGEYEAALRLLDDEIKNAEEPDELVLKKVTLLAQAGRGAEGVELAEQRLAEDEKDTRRWFVYRAACMEAREYGKIEAKIREWMKIQQTAPALVEWLAEALLQADRAEDALGVANAFQAQPGEVDLVLRRLRAKCLAKAGKWETAAADLQTLMEDRVLSLRQGDQDDVRRQLIGVLLDAKQYDRALEWVDKWLKAANADDLLDGYDFLKIRSTILNAAGRTEAYVEEMRRIMERGKKIERLAVERSSAPLLNAIQRDLSGFNNDLGYTWLERHENVERSVEMIREAVAESPLNHAFLDSLGWAYYKTGDFANARKYLERSTRVTGGDDETVFDHLGDAEIRLGDAEAAKKRWTKALELLSARAAKPKDEDAKLTASLREKLEALKAGAAPRVAPLLSEMQK